jgi:hypothetical protein
LATTLDTVCYGSALVDELLADLREGGGTVILNTGDFARWIAWEMATQLAPECARDPRVHRRLSRR